MIVRHRVTDFVHVLHMGGPKRTNVCEYRRREVTLTTRIDHAHDEMIGERPTLLGRNSFRTPLVLPKGCYCSFLRIAWTETRARRRAIEKIERDRAFRDTVRGTVNVVLLSIRGPGTTSAFGESVPVHLPTSRHLFWLQKPTQSDGLEEVY